MIRLVGTATGEPTEFDGTYVKFYDPTYVHPDGYDGGTLEVTKDPREAMQFPDLGAALAKWRQAFGWGGCGQPNRPLTAWTVTFEEVES